MSDFTHLHVHTQYSTLDGASQIPALVDKAMADGMRAVAITDHGNMFGVKEFVNYIGKKNGKINDEIKALQKELKNPEITEEQGTEIKAKIESAQKKLFKPIIGCEAYMAPGSRTEKMKTDKPSRYHLILLAKNKTGYHNLVKLVSLGFIEGFYGRPRIDREILEKYKEGIIVASACLAGEIPKNLQNNDMVAAEEALLWFKNQFGGDFYLELQRHQTNKPDASFDVFQVQQKINPLLVQLAQKHQLKVIATNDVHFVNENEAEAHDRLLCISTGTDIYDPSRMRYTKQEWFKTKAEMEAVFSDIPEALGNTGEIVDKVEIYDINSAPIMPDFPLPEEFDNADNYLKHLTYEGAKKRYPEITPEIKERIDFELATIEKMGYPGYFLIVQDFIAAARQMGVSVGPGRGSAAGSVVAYCLWITDIDPIKYDLLFERFLNPDRISMPDIDIDFDDDGRGQVLQWVTEKYGKEKVAHIITFGTMAAKSAIKDVARVQKLPLPEAERLSKLIDEIPRDEKPTIKNGIEKVSQLKEAFNSSDTLVADTLKYAQMLEGTVRQTGVHACGVVIGRDDLTNYVPISTAFDKETNSDVLVTQYEGSLIEEVGLMKMDFLGLKTLSIIKDALSNIKIARGIDVDLDNMSLEDKLTYELYSRGDTVGTFQFESDGMRKYLRELKPTKFEDLIAMNALYRPGPMEYIPDFIDRKHGRKKIEYDIPVMEQYLKDTYGITVYQEQVMLLSRLLAGFTRGQSDELRKAMGKKLREKMAALKLLFIEGCKANGYPEKIVVKIWEDWEKFASYAFNKSHATCYSWVAYQTAYLKANYPSEYMAAVLSRSISNITDITKFMDECRRMGIEVLGPDVNESNLTFTVNKQGNIRFGLGAIKGVGGNAVAAIVDERSRNGTFKDIFDFVERVNLSACNKKNMEALAQAGAFDNLGGIKREQFFAITGNNEETFTEILLRFGNLMQTDKAMSQNTLFGGSDAIAITRPEIPRTEEWSMLEKLNREKDLIGMYLSSHPLNPFKIELNYLVNTSIVDFQDLEKIKGKEFSIAGLVSSVHNAISKNGNPWGALTLEDFTGSHEFRFFGKDYEMFRNYIFEGYPLFIRGSVQMNFRNEWEAKVKSITMLNNVKEELLKSVSLIVPLEKISQEWIDTFSSHIEKSKGNTLLKFKIIDPSENRMVEMFARKQRINFSGELVDYLDEMNIDFKIND